MATKSDRIRKAEAKYAYRLTEKDKKSVQRAASFIMQRDRDTLRGGNGKNVAEELLRLGTGTALLTKSLEAALQDEKTSPDTATYPVAVQVEKIIEAYYRDAMRELDKFLKRRK